MAQTEKTIELVDRIQGLDQAAEAQYRQQPQQATIPANIVTGIAQGCARPCRRPRPGRCGGEPVILARRHVLDLFLHL